MNKRQISFMNMLLNHSGDFLPIDFFSEKLDVSSKTLRRDLELVEKFLKSFQAEIEKKSGVGIRLSINQNHREQLHNHISYLTYVSRNSNQQSWEKDSRRMDIALNLLLYSDEYTSLSSLSYKYYVSKSTINHDLVLLEDMLEQFSLRIRKTVNGTIISGNERGIRKAIVYILSYIMDPGVILARKGETAQDSRLPNPNTLATILDIFREDDICLVNQILCRIEEKYQYKFNDSEFVNVSLSLLVMAYRLINGMGINQLEEYCGDGPGNDQKAGEIAEEVSARMMEHYQMEFPSIEREEIKSIFFVTRLLQPTVNYGKDNEVFHYFCEDFIDAFTTITNINLRENPTFCENVISHINLMLNRLYNGTPASNPLMELLIKDYQSTLNVCRIICSILADKFKLPQLSIDEISFLMLYILGETVRQSEHASVLFVTELSKSVANLTRLRLQQHFPHWNFDTCTPREYVSVKAENYDFCVSTAMLETGQSGLPYVFVSPILENRDFQNIQELFWQTSESASAYQLELIRLINDLHDIGCEINFNAGHPKIKTKVLVKIQALKEIQYIYSINDKGENHCIFTVDDSRKHILEVHIYMANLDFMLFSSKIVYLLDNCPGDVLPEFIHYFMEEDSYV